MTVAAPPRERDDTRSHFPDFVVWNDWCHLRRRWRRRTYCGLKVLRGFTAMCKDFYLARIGRCPTCGKPACPECVTAAREEERRWRRGR
jgi:hypothetical protein